MENEENPTDGAQESQPSWLIDDDTPGVGDRPEWLPEKFKSAKALAKSYSELEKRIGTSPQAPESYDFGDYKEVFDPENEHMANLQNLYKENKISQEVFEKTMESMTGYLVPDVAAERAKIGEDADKRIEILDNWAKANFSEKAFNALTSTMVTSDAILAIEEIRNKMLEGKQTPPSSSDETGTPPEYTRKELEQEMYENREKYKSDSKYRAEMKAKFSRVAANAGFVDKRGG